MIAPLDRAARITEQGGPVTLEFQLKWSELLRELAALDSAVSSRVSTRTVTASDTAMMGDYLILADATAGAVTVTLPPVGESIGALIVVKKSDASANAVTVDGNGSETIDGAANVALAAQYDAVTVASNGVEWWIV
jgi:hypothetical protein